MDNLNSRMERMEEKFSESEGRIIGITQTEPQRGKYKQKPTASQNMQDCDERSNLHIIGVPEGKKEDGARNYF